MNSALMMGGNSKNSVSSSRDLASEIFDLIQTKYNLSSTQFRAVIDDISQKISPPQPPFDKKSFPVDIISKELTILESVVKFLHENKNKTLSEVGKLTGRNQRNLWHTYESTKKKCPLPFTKFESKFSIPLSIFTDEKLSPSEAVVFYLREVEELSLKEISVLLSRDNRTIWTLHNRAKKKHAKK
jgi:hypothetical protein